MNCFSLNFDFTVYKKYIVFIVLLFLLLPLFASLIAYSSYQESSGISENTLELSANNPILEYKILGNDDVMKDISFHIKDISVSDNAYLQIYYLKGSPDLNKATVLKKSRISAVDIEKGQLKIGLTKDKQIYNRDFFILISAIGFSSDDKISFLLSKDGALSHDATMLSEKNNALFLWKLLVFIFGISFATSIICKVNFFHALGIDIVLFTILLYFLGLIDNFSLILPVFYSLSVFSWGLVVLRIIRTKSIKIEYSYCAEIVLFFLFIILYLFQSKFLFVHEWDEMTHWATTVEGMWLFERMPQHFDYWGSNYRYLPGYSLFLLFVMKVYGVYSEHILYLAMFIMCSMFGLGALSEYLNSKKSIWHYTIAIVFILLIPDIMMGSKKSLPSTLYADVVFGFATALFLVNIARFINKKSQKNLVELFFTTFALMLIKESGIIVVVAMAIGLSCTSFINYIFFRVLLKEYLLAAITVLVSAFLSRISWDCFLNSRIDKLDVQSSYEASFQSAMNFNLQDVIDLFLGNSKTYRYDLIFSQFKYWLYGAAYEERFVTLSILGLLLLIIFLFVIAYKNNSCKLYSIGNKICAITISIIALFFGYYFVYAFTLTEAEAKVFASAPRYIGSFLMGISFLLLYYYKISYQKNKVSSNSLQHTINSDKKLTRSSMLIITVCTVLSGGYDGIKDALNCISFGLSIPHEKILRSKLRETDRLFWISSEEDGYNYIKVNYYTAPIKKNNRNYYNEETHEREVKYMVRASEPNVYERKVSLEELEKELYSYDYFYMEKTDKRFKKDYGELFRSDDEIKAGILYKIDKSNNDILLLPDKIVYE